MGNLNHLAEVIARDVDASVDCLLRFRDEQLPSVLAAAETLIKALAAGRKVLIFGNGGSAAQAQHLSAELVNRFLSNTRPPLPAIALSTDTSVLTSIANDRSYDDVFAVQIQALGQPGDVAVGISTSGNSNNVNNALRLARSMGLATVGLNGKTGGAMKDLLDVEIRVGGGGTPQIQEVQDVVIHALCHVIDIAFDRPAEVRP